MTYYRPANHGGGPRRYLHFHLAYKQFSAKLVLRTAFCTHITHIKLQMYLLKYGF